jgi:hypothetical protein
MQVQFPVCGFVPPHILEAIAASDFAAEESRTACKDALKYKRSCSGLYHSTFTEVQVSFLDIVLARRKLKPIIEDRCSRATSGVQGAYARR